MGHLSLTLLGSFQAQVDSRPVIGFESDKVRALLVYLAVEAERPHRREALAGLLWPEHPEPAARHNLSHTLFSLRRALNDRGTAAPFLLVDRNSLQFNRESDHWLDVACFTNHIAACASHGHVRLEHCDECLALLQQAVDLYQGSFLTGFSLAGSPPFEEWALLARERYHRQVMEALAGLVTCLELRGQVGTALSHAWRQVELDPWREEAHCQVMRLLARSGQRSAALAQYEQCRRVLVEELDVEPSTETTALFEQIKAETTRIGPQERGKRGQPVSLYNPLLPPGAHDPRPPIPRHNLPAPLTPLVGRTQEVAAVQRLFREERARLVTLTGMGGVGKTRLALQVAEELLDDFPDGVYFVELAPIREPTLVISAIAQTLDVRELGGRPLLELVQARLRGRVTLLLLDNFEHLAAAAPVVAALLAACPYVKVLCTSREILHLRGEYEVIVPPLPVPPQPGQIAAEGLAEFAAVELFRQRAVAAKHGFVLSDDNGATVARICARLDGLPLAIELAAARLKLLSPQALWQRLADDHEISSLRFLKVERRDAPGRHRSLWDTIAWSYDLLSQEEQALFRCMGVFAGGCTLEAVAAVYAHEGGMDIWDEVTSLVDKNLVQQVEAAEGEPRFVMLETLREFAWACLRERPEALAVQRRHAQYYLALAERADRYLQGKEQTFWLGCLSTEHDNLRAALLWAMAQQEIELSLRLGAALPRFWIRHGNQQEAYARLTALVQLCEGKKPQSPIEDILYYVGLFAQYWSDSKVAFAYFEKSAVLSRRLGNSYRLSFILALLGDMAYERGEYVAADNLHEEGLQLSHELEDEWNIAMCLSHQGRQLATRGHLEQGRRLCEQGLALHRQIGDKWGTAVSLNNLGIVLRLQGCFIEAQTLLEEGLQLGWELGDPSCIAWPCQNLGWVWVEQGAVVTAQRFLQEALRLYNQIGARRQIADTVAAFARVSALRNQPERALRLISTAVTNRAALGFVLAPLLQAAVDQLIQSARGVLSEEAAAIAWAEGQAMSLEQAVAYALAGGDTG